MTASTKAGIASEFLMMCATGQVERAYAEHVAADFRHHNAYFPGDRESLLRGMEASARREPNNSFTVKQTVESADRVAVLSHLCREQAGMEIAVVHILRFEGDKIVEMWDVGQQIPPESPNKLGMF